MLGGGAPAYRGRSVTISFEDKKHDIVERNISAVGEGMEWMRARQEDQDTHVKVKPGFPARMRSLRSSSVSEANCGSSFVSTL